MATIFYENLGVREYGETWDYQESIMQKGLTQRAINAKEQLHPSNNIDNYLLTVTHPHVYTLGKSGSIDNLLLDDKAMKEKEVTFYKTNRGGDITYHGPGQLVAYPILDLEQFGTDLGLYMRNLEEVIINTIAEYGIHGERLAGATGVWIDATDAAKARKICAMGVKCSRWITIHGLALNMNTDLDYFGHIVPCGISDKGVTSIAKEIGKKVDEADVLRIFLEKFAAVFAAEIKM